MIKLNPIKTIFTLGSILALAGAITHFFKLNYAPYLFSVGAALIVFLQVKQAIDTRNVASRQKQLSRNGLFSSLLLILAAYFMFVGSNSWVVALLIYSLSSLLLTFRGGRD